MNHGLSDLSMRSAQNQEIQDIVSIEQQLFPNPWPFDAFQRLFKQDNYSILVALSNDNVVGYVIFSLEGLSFLDVLQNYSPRGHILNLAVKPSFQRKGIGSLLLKRALDNIWEEGYNKVELEVKTDNNPAINFYQARGFSKFKTIGNFYSNGDDAHLMHKNINKS